MRCEALPSLWTVLAALYVAAVLTVMVTAGPP